MHDCNIEHALQEKGLRRTTDRHRILELFAEKRTWTAASVQRTLGNLNLSTVYRNLKRLVKEGLVSVADVSGGEEHFEQPPTMHHDHLACVRCTVVECLPCPIPTVQTHQLQLKGLCTACTT